MNADSMNPNWLPPQRSSKGWLWGLGIGCAIVAVFCCGGLGVVGFFGYRMVGEGMSQDPAVVKARADALIELALPAAMKPVLSMEMKIPFTDERLMSMAIFQDQEKESGAILMQVAATAGPQAEVQLKQSLDQQKMKTDRKLTDARTTTRTITVRDQKTEISIVEGKDAEKKTPRLQITGTLAGKTGPVVLQMDLDAEAYPVEKVVAILEAAK